jgi:DNA-binding transcriptional LysR family regulator
MNLYNFDLNLLVAFDALLEERSVTDAAERLGLSQPAMSNALARLRRVVGDPLFVRTSEGMAPTPRAQEIAEPIRQALNHIQQALQQQRAFIPAAAERTFTIATTDYAELVLLPRLMEKLATDAPGVNLTVVAVGSEVPMAELESGRIDAALGRFREVPAGVHAQTLFRERLVCVVRTEHPDVGKQLTLKQLTTLPHVLVSTQGASPGVVDEVLARQGLRRRVVLWAPHFLIIPIVVAQTNLIATLPERVARFFAQFLPLRILAVPIRLSPYPVLQLWHERTHHDPAQQWLRGLLAELGKSV